MTCQVHSQSGVFSLWHTQARRGCASRRPGDGASLTPHHFKSHVTWEAPGTSCRKWGREVHSSYLGWLLLLALVLCCFDRVGDCGHTVQVLSGQSPLYYQEEDGGRGP